MRAVYPVVFMCMVTMVLIEKESSILSRLSNIIFQRETTAPTPKPLDSTTPTTTVSTGADLLSAATVTDWTVPTEQSESVNYNPDVQIGAQRHLLLMAITRTGSSFVGQFFNQQKENVFYLYEPLWHVASTYKPSNTTLLENYQDVLHGLFHCNFSRLEQFVRPRPEDHITSVIFRRESSYALCEKSVCSPVRRDRPQRFPCKKPGCGPLNLTMVSEACKSWQNLVIKSVRVRQLEALKVLMEDPQLNLKIIQLVRDPRAIVTSRVLTFSYRYPSFKALAQVKDLEGEGGKFKSLKKTCEEIRKSAEIGLSRPPWLKNNYMLMRYEDIASDPVEKAKEMYKFAGIPFSPQVQEWILNNTDSPVKTSAFSTTKNASAQIDKWRPIVPFPLVQAVQKICGPTMKLFGYKFVDDEKTLLNVSISLVEEKRFG